MNVAEFVAKWKKVVLKERSGAQEHFIDLCRVLDHPTPVEADPTAASPSASSEARPRKGGFRDRWI